MVKLANERNIEQVLNEFKGYAQEVDVEVIRKAVRSIGRLAIRLEKCPYRSFAHFLFGLCVFF